MRALLNKMERWASAIQRRWGPEWLAWQPGIVSAVLARHHSVEASGEELEAFIAYRVVLQSDEVLTNPALFENVARALSRQGVIADTWQGSSVLGLAATLFALKEVLGPERVLVGMGEPVRAYIATILFEDDVPAAPEALHFDVARSKMRALLGRAALEGEVTGELHKILGKGEASGKMKAERLRYALEEVEDETRQALLGRLVATADILASWDMLGPYKPDDVEAQRRMVRSASEGALARA